MGLARCASDRGHGRDQHTAAGRLILLSFLLLLVIVDGAKYAKICQLQSSPPVSVKYDSATGQFSLADDMPKENNAQSGVDEGGRMLAGADGQPPRAAQTIVQLGRHEMSGSKNFLRANRNNRLMETESNPDLSSSSSNKQTFIARSCPCDDSGRTYCLIDGISGAVPDSCGVPYSDNFNTIFAKKDTNSSDISVIYNTMEIGCFELNSQTVFIRNAWPVVVLWYGALFIFLLATSNGKFARAYVLHLLCPRLRTIDRQVESILARETELRTRLRGAAVIRAANLAQGPGRHLVRTPGVRIPSRTAWRRAGMTQEEERQEATRWWIEQAEHLGILSSVEVPQQVEYVLKTKIFNAQKERARREQMRLMNAKAKSAELVDVKSDAECLEGVSSMVSTPSKKRATGEEGEGPSTPETVAITLNGSGSDDDQSISSSPDESDIVSKSGQHIICSEDEDTFECTICLTEVEDGEQVGVLPCTHIFHVDCLRQWITRKNACPLCQVTELATPRPIEAVEEGSGDEDESSFPLELEMTSSERNAVSGNEEEGGNNNSPGTNQENMAQNATPWYRPRFFFPTSDNTQRSASVPSRLALSLSTSSLSDAERRSQRHERQQRRRRRDGSW
mmetsp:Transcript_20611/g.44773  ORF Transcript_20611/g.44773 Transcript_20611/m.44773 type:complete len:621 (-) Transcript_20611:26-1888(-)